MSFELDWNFEELDKVLAAIDQSVFGTAVKNAAWAGAGVIEEAAKRYAPGPHIIRVSVSESNSVVEIAIGPDEDHWYYVFFETGVSAHEIPVAKNQGEVILHFQGSGGDVYVYKVSHPGMAAKPFMRPAVDTSREKAMRTVGQELLINILRAAGVSSGAGL